ncbi:sigma factor-like helix-turn-helix DNA-binding protein [Streptomyces sp. NPDC057695]|uniref:sigma factor-like helix-turn-helix DNA-binding protein n=1 Tax=unclassified Streptomyces TaxID=2593676 RepID=UPI003640EEE1
MSATKSTPIRRVVDYEERATNEQIAYCGPSPGAVPLRTIDATQKRHTRDAPPRPAFDEAAEQVEAGLASEQVETRPESEQVRRCLLGLTDLQRQAVTLASYQGLTYPELAESLRTPLPTIKTRMRDGLIRRRAAWG